MPRKQNVATGLKRRKDAEAVQPRDRHLPDRKSLRGRKTHDVSHGMHEVHRPTLKNASESQD